MLEYSDDYFFKHFAVDDLLCNRMLETRKGAAPISQSIQSGDMDSLGVASVERLDPRIKRLVIVNCPLGLGSLVDIMRANAHIRQFELNRVAFEHVRYEIGPIAILRLCQANLPQLEELRIVNLYVRRMDGETGNLQRPRRDPKVYIWNSSVACEGLTVSRYSLARYGFPDVKS